MLPFMWLIISLILSFFNVGVEVINFQMLILTTLLTFASMFIGMLFSIAIPSQLKATELLMVISTPAFILSGFTWPTSAIPEVITNVAQFIPVTQYLSGFRKVAFYGGDFTSIMPEIKFLTGVILVAVITMILLLQFKINRLNRRQN
jgi:ABC-2 type transport system permease protein